MNLQVALALTEEEAIVFEVVQALNPDLTTDQAIVLMMRQEMCREWRSKSLADRMRHLRVRVIK
jgi:hypothetical protein